MSVKALFLPLILVIFSTASFLTAADRLENAGNMMLVINELMASNSGSVMQMIVEGILV